MYISSNLCIFWAYLRSTWNIHELSWIILNYFELSQILINKLCNDIFNICEYSYKCTRYILAQFITFMKARINIPLYEPTEVAYGPNDGLTINGVDPPI